MCYHIVMSRFPDWLVELLCGGGGEVTAYASASFVAGSVGVAGAASVAVAITASKGIHMDARAYGRATLAQAALAAVALVAFAVLGAWISAGIAAVLAALPLASRQRHLEGLATDPAAQKGARATGLVAGALGLALLLVVF